MVCELVDWAMRGVFSPRRPRGGGGGSITQNIFVVACTSTGGFVHPSTANLIESGREGCY